MRQILDQFLSVLIRAVPTAETFEALHAPFAVHAPRDAVKGIALALAVDCGENPPAMLHSFGKFHGSFWS